MPVAPRPNPPQRTAADSAVAAAKAALRTELRAGRQVPESAGATLHRANAALTISREYSTIALYCSVAHEPDTWALIDTLHANGCTVLLPVLGRRPDGSVRGEVDWAVYGGRGELRVGFAGILEPTSAALGADGVKAASLIWCAALAATPSGDRLGTGGGWYDRALTHATPEALVGVLLRDCEVLDEVPVQPFDRSVDLIVTESRTIRAPQIRAGATI